MTSALSNAVFGNAIPTLRGAPGIDVFWRKLLLLVSRGQRWTTARDFSASFRGVFSHPPQCRAILGRFSAGAALKAALAEVQVDVVFGYVSKTGVCICRSNGA